MHLHTVESSASFEVSLRGVGLRVYRPIFHDYYILVRRLSVSLASLELSMPLYLTPLLLPPALLLGFYCSCIIATVITLILLPL